MIATNLNIDGRLLAQMVCDRLINKLTDPSRAAATDWLSIPHGPDPQFSAAWFAQEVQRSTAGRRRPVPHTERGGRCRH
jgi:hypothetical protein